MVELANGSIGKIFKKEIPQWTGLEKDLIATVDIDSNGIDKIDDENHFVCRIKENILYKVLKECDLQEQEDPHILLDQQIQLTGKPAVANKMSKTILRRIVVFMEDKKGNWRQIELITNNLEWKASTIAELYKRRWRIEIFFKFLKQNLQIKTFIGTSENACKSKIWIAFITYFLLELLRRVLINSCQVSQGC